MEELGGEDVPERVRRHALALADAARLDVVTAELVQLGVLEPLALDADEERSLDERLAGRVVVDDQRGSAGWIGMVRCRPPFALRKPSAGARVDVVPVKPEELAAAEAAVREERRQEAITLELATEMTLP